MGEVFDAFFALLGTQRATEVSIPCRMCSCEEWLVTEHTSVIQVHNTLMQRQAAWRENEGAQAVSLTIGK